MKQILIFLIAIISFSCNQNEQQNKKEEASEQKNNEPETVNSVKLFLIKNGFKEDADISEVQIEEIKEFLEAGTFDEIPICQAFYDFSKMKEPEASAYLKKFKLPKGKDRDILSVFLNFTARKLCFQYPTAKKPKTKEEIESLFSSYNGSLPSLVQEIKKQMKDPDSFEHIETSYSNIKSKLIVEMKYSGINSFNTRVIQEVTATVDFDGNVIRIYKNE